MKRIILFRFHKNPEVCINRLKLLKKLNPDIPIYGLGENIKNIEKLYKAGIEDVFTIKNKSKRWKWLNGDLAILKWFNNIGKNLNFDILHVIEWDLLLTEPLTKIYKKPSKNTVYMSGLIKLKKARKHNWSYLTGSNYQTVQWFKKHLQKTFSKKVNGKIGLFPGVSLGYNFLKKYNNIDRIPEIINDEFRVGMYASMFENIKLKDTKFYKWNKKTNQINKNFNSKNNRIPKKRVLNNKNKVKAFHPFTQKLKPTKI